MSTLADDRRYMKIALEEAAIAASSGEVPVGAVITRGKDVIAVAGNRREYCRDATAHAEVIAIRDACRVTGNWRLSGCTLYVTLEPCAMCAGAIMNARLDRLVYGANDNSNGAVHSWFGIPFTRGWNHALAVTAGILEEDCEKIMLDFFSKVR